MRVPAEFAHLVHCFYQGSSSEVSTMEEWVALALSHLGKQQKTIVKRFLQQLLARNPDDAELQQMWDDAGPDYGFPGPSLRGVLTLIRDSID
ncbi:MAG: hypothetical protein K2Y19_20510 [Afipia birgiae]|jgi:hypothetical protein|nr:hypothetical protein [Afipia birgiae]